jgi:hypothetical protein
MPTHLREEIAPTRADNREFIRSVGAAPDERLIACIDRSPVSSIWVGFIPSLDKRCATITIGRFLKDRVSSKQRRIKDPRSGLRLCVEELDSIIAALELARREAQAVSAAPAVALAEPLSEEFDQRGRSTPM